MAINYLTKEQLIGYENYKYSSVDTSPLSNYVMHPFWNQAVKLVPRWLAPNVLTFTGFMLTVVNAFLLAYYDYEFCASSDIYPICPPIPQWVWIVCAINQFLAHTLDGIDGKHARRTNSSGPLGELMDHGLDSWAALFMPTCLYSVFGRGEYSCSPLRVYFVLCCVNFCFLLSHWEKYNTGILYLPWTYDISQIVLLTSFLITYFKSYKFFKFTILNFGSGEFVEILIYVGALGMTLPMNFCNIYRAYKTQTLKQKSIRESLRPLLPVTLLFILTTIWALFSPNDIINKEPRMFYWMTGTVFSNIACSLIISQMTSTRCEVSNWLLYPVGIVMLLVFGLPQVGEKEIFLLRILTLFTVLAHINYGVHVVRQMCRHFKIYCFSLKKVPAD
ncbi:ethanolaminephosphotransferase 1 [Centruroides vittatus]|uniref:ethanolaminephosphotransferase 1 n=1 Tax=Centruroides vittatus TaxID=120091 RepID=UPI003510477F